MDNRLQKWTLIAGIAFLILKFAAYFLTLSNAILTDALESIVNVLAGGFGLFALYLSSLPKDENHPYGHGKIEFVSASIEGLLIAIAGGSMAVAGLYALWSPPEVHQLDAGLALIGLTGIGNFVMGNMLVAKGKEQNSPAMQASGAHLRSDAYTTAALFLGLFIVLLTQKIWLDSVLTLIMGGLLMKTGIEIVKNAMGGIMDETNYQLTADVIDCLQQNRKANWIDIHNFRIIQYGSALHIDCHLTVPYFFTVANAHDILQEVEETLDANTERSMELFIHTDPCIPSVSCSICAKADCPVREKAFTQQIIWSVENALRNEKHSV